MKSIFALTIAALLPLAAAASNLTPSGATTARLGSKVISVGDTQARVFDAGGTPVLRRELFNDFGVKTGERWTYNSSKGRHTVILFSVDGIVLDVTDVVGQ